LIEAAITMKAIPKKRSELLQTLRLMKEQISMEKGCLNCFFYQDANDENMFIITEEWATQEELNRYLKSDIFGALIGANSLLIEPADINIKVVSYTAGMEAVKQAREQSRILNEKEKKL